MKRTRQNSLQDRLSAMFRILPSVAASALVFSLVFFSPLFDQKDTIAAVAQSGDGGGSGGGGGKGGGGSGGGGSGGGGGSNGSGGSSGGGEDFADESRKKAQKQAQPNSSGNSNKSASEKSRSNDLLDRIIGRRQFDGDSEPSGGPLSRNQEREAIQNGWR
ncbi:hypothetical protein [Roseibium sp. MMSF_3412]|uniref:hypothetical protein n=1 Tax=Roseibium sp. MMSF_3412 TaxID=3046712 RepID=UPI00273EACAC|nr:hypothetical protein [Roseibium sp. MMSF_3412]